MKRLKIKSGFTLVECIVAMAVLTIMSLLLMMILSMTVNQRNSNMTMERELDQQVGMLVEAGAVVTEAQNDEIVFKQNGAEIEKIPGHNSEGMVANKVYYDNMDSELDALDYDFSGYEKFEDISHGGGGDGDSGSGGTSRVYGAVDLSGNVSIQETGNVDSADGTTKTVTLVVTFTPSDPFDYDGSYGTGVDKGVKIKVPSSADVTSAKILSSSGSCYKISKNVVRVQPTSASEHKAEIIFEISTSAYDDSFKNVSHFYTGSGTSNTVSVAINTEIENP
ncbi:MAG: type II secretion system GspH family protein [Bacteroides sp.]|nr:type II secretion system GspH family protein [Bacteroides sp.]